MRVARARRRGLVLTVWMMIASCGLVATPILGAGTTAYVHGKWFDGERFVDETVYVVAGRLRRDAPPAIDQTIDLGGHFVVPPFAEAHNHNTGDAASRRYLDAGVLYVANPNNLPRERQSVAGGRWRPDRIDVAYANGGLTGPGGHPIEIARRAIERSGWTEADGEGAFYHTVDSIAHLDRVWPVLLATRPDFVKTYLLYSEQFEKRLRDESFVGRRGLDPTLLPEIGRRAHQARLRVFTHVESAADFRHAVRAGADVIAHLPGFRGPDDESVDPADTFSLTADDAREAAAHGVVVVTTVGGVAQLAPEGPMAAVRRAADELHRHNLQLLAAAGVRLAVGSDAWEDTSVGEALYLHGLGVFDEATLLRLWTTDTARVIFPDRAIGTLADGNEASFIVLEGDPLADFGQVRHVVMIVKDGVVRLPSAAR